MSNHTYTKKIGGDSIDLFLVFQVERETVMTAEMMELIRTLIKDKGKAWGLGSQNETAQPDQRREEPV